MAYQALYRVWRSQRFEDIVGQQAITQTLKNAIAQKKTSHAYLFTGPRGTGKTSAAKIFAKAINCPHSSEGEPCNACATCIAITEGRLNDVIEIDAASNNGVEEIRDIRDKVKYAPTEAMYKVYIIDEVHMLSAGAFNALLKTLEEPPANVVFILATTEPHKIPLTIISRTQRFDFKRIPTQAIVQHMSDILKKSGIEYEDEALFVIARAAEGGMRDALSILDQSLSFSDGVIRKKDAIQVTGSLTNEMMDSYLNSCFSHHVEEALGILEGLLNEGKEAHRFLEDLLLYCRDLLMFQQAPQIVIEKTGAMTDKFKELATTTDPVTIYEYIEAFNDTQNQIRFTNNPNVYLEVVTVKLASSTEKVIQNSSVVSDGSSSLQIDSTALEDLNQQIKTLQKQVKEIQKQGITNSPSEGANGASDTIQRKVQNTKTTFRVPSERVYQVLQEATKDILLKVKEVWADLLSMLSVTQRAMLKASDIVAAGPERMVLAFDYEIVCQRATDDKDLQEAVQTGLARLIQYEPEMVCIPVEHWGSLRKTYLSEHQLQARASEENTDEPKIEMELVPEDIKKEDLVVDEAFAIFGEDVVKVVND